jgi:Flp pilus assembly protein TadD
MDASCRICRPRITSEREGRKDDYAHALDAARRAVALFGALPEARFNLALATEQTGSPADARAAWNAYLQLDPSSQWAAEARRHLNDLPR